MMNYCLTCSLGYQAPETIADNSTYHPGRADIWSLAVCLYSMITGVFTDIQHSRAADYKTVFIYPASVAVSEEIHEVLAGALLIVPQYRLVSNSLYSVMGFLSLYFLMIVMFVH